MSRGTPISSVINAAGILPDRRHEVGLGAGLDLGDELVGDLGDARLLRLRTRLGRSAFMSTLRICP